jgi:adenosylhomocysteinase
MFEDLIQPRYDERDYPALRQQRAEWAAARPLAGLRVLDATPVFRNTLPKYEVLLDAGAELTVGRSAAVAGDPAIFDLLAARGIPLLAAGAASPGFDLVLDCAGRFADAPSRHGYVELTRTGVDIYRDVAAPVFIADASEIKRIETSLGTGDGFFRAMTQLGHADWPGRRLLVVGSGKVGSGIIDLALARGARVQVVTDTRAGAGEWRPAGLEGVTDYRDRAAVARLIEWAEVVVTATGVRHALDHPELAGALQRTAALLANMGVEDEYGPAVPAARVLYQKQSLNFLLEEPTWLRYIDASLALHNALGLELVQRAPGARGILPLPPGLEAALLEITRRAGRVFAATP